MNRPEYISDTTTNWIDFNSSICSSEQPAPSHGIFSFNTSFNIYLSFFGFQEIVALPFLRRVPALLHCALVGRHAGYLRFAPRPAFFRPHGLPVRQSIQPFPLLRLNQPCNPWLFSNEKLGLYFFYKSLFIKDIKYILITYK